MFEEISKAIRQSSNIIILPHKSADGDCLGSAYALKLMVEQLGKNAVVLADEDNPKMYGILFGVDGISEIKPDLAVAIDCGDIERLGKRKDAFASVPVTVNIDHHPTNTFFATYNYVDANSAATGQIIFELLEYMKIELTKEIAHNIYIAMASDTGRFAYSNVKPKTLIIAAKLLEAGIDHVGINEVLFEKNPMSKIVLMRNALNAFETYLDGKISLVSVTKEQVIASGATEEDAGGLILLPRSLETCVVAVCLRESTEKPCVKVSLRSNVVDVSEIAQKFGGGGHFRASGCTIDGDIKTAKEQLLSELFKVMQ